MTLIDSQNFQTITNILGTIVFAIFVIWAIWFASKMK